MAALARFSGRRASGSRFTGADWFREQGAGFSRRRVLAGLCGGGLAAGAVGVLRRAGGRPEIATVRIDDLAAGAPIDPFHLRLE